MKLKTNIEINELAKLNAWSDFRDFDYNCSLSSYEYEVYLTAFNKAFQMCQQDLLASASEGFNQFFAENFSVNENGELQCFAKTMSGERNIGINNVSLEKLWQAATLANEKKYQERINDARKDILYLIGVLVTYPVLIESKDNMGSLHQNIKEFIEKWELNK